MPFQHSSLAAASLPFPKVGMFGDINKWQSKLDGIANKYETDDEEGLHGVFTGESVQGR